MQALLSACDSGDADVPLNVAVCEYLYTLSLEHLITTTRNSVYVVHIQASKAPNDDTD